VTHEVSVDPTDEGLEELLIFLRDMRGFDFTGYKRSSLARRMRKRMNDLGVAGFSDYRDRLEIDADEFRTLFNTILINVTSFFRDADCWTYLQREIIPELLASRTGEGEIRIWSAGCSTGEEPYSLAILFAEVLGLEECTRRVKIYAPTSTRTPCGRPGVARTRPRPSSRSRRSCGTGTLRPRTAGTPSVTISAGA